MHFKEYATTTGVAAFFMFARFIYYPVLAPYMKSAGLTDAQVGLIMSVFGIIVFFTAPIIGHISDKIGRRAVMMFGMLCSIGALALFIVDQHWFNFVFARILMAIGFVSVMVVGIARIEDHLDDKDRGKYSGWSLTFIDSARIFAPLLGGLIADYYFVKLPFLIGIFILITQFLYLLSMKKPKREVHMSKQDLNIIKMLKTFILNRNLRAMGFLGMAMHASLSIQAMFIPLLVREQWGMPYRYVGYVLFALMVTHMFQFAFGKFADKIGSGRGVLLGTGMYGLTLAAMFFADNYTLLIVLAFVLGIWSSVWNVSVWAYMSEIGERQKNEGEVTCSYMSWAKLGSFASFALGGFFVTYFGIPAFMMLIGGLIILMTALCYRLILHTKA